MLIPSQIGRVLESARHHFIEAKSLLNNRSPLPGAYWAYLVAYELVVVEIPKHRDYHDKISAARGQMYHDFSQLLKVHISKRNGSVQILADLG